MMYRRTMLMKIMDGNSMTDSQMQNWMNRIQTISSGILKFGFQSTLCMIMRFKMKLPRTVKKSENTLMMTSVRMSYAMFMAASSSLHSYWMVEPSPLKEICSCGTRISKSLAS